MLPLLLLPGIEGDGRIWSNTQALLGDRECRSLDLPSSGDDLHEIARSVLSEIAWPRFWVAGLSLGGLVGRAMAEVEPSRLEGLVMIGCLPTINCLPRGVRVSSRGLVWLPGTLIQRLYRRRIMNRLLSEGLPREEAHDLCTRLPEKSCYLSRLSAIERWGLSSEIELPSLLLRGKAEVEAPWSLQEARDALPGTSVEAIEGGHRAPWTHPKAVASRLGRFMGNR